MTTRETRLAHRTTVAQAQAIRTLHEQGIESHRVYSLLSVLRFASEHILNSDSAEEIAAGISRMLSVWQEREWMREELTRSNRDSLRSRRALTSREQELAALQARVRELEEELASSQGRAEHLEQGIAQAVSQKEEAFSLLKRLLAHLDKISELGSRITQLSQRHAAAELRADQAEAALANERSARREQVDKLLVILTNQHRGLFTLMEKLSHRAAEQAMPDIGLPLALARDRRVTHLERDVRDLESHHTAAQYDHGYRDALEAENARLRAELERLRQERTTEQQQLARFWEQAAAEAENGIRGLLNRYGDTGEA